MTKRANGEGDVYPRKNKDGQITSYRGAYFGADGKRHYVSGKTKTAARNALATARTNAAGGIPPSPANLTAEKYLSMWLIDSIEGRFSRATYDAAKRDIHFHIVPVLGRRKLKELSRDDIRALYRIKRDEGHSNRTLEYIHTTLRWALKDAKNDGKIAHNPTDGVKPYKTLEGAAKESKALALSRSPRCSQRRLGAAWKLSMSSPSIRDSGEARYWRSDGMTSAPERCR